MIHTGPNSKIVYTEKVKAKVNTLKFVLIFSSLVVPFVIYGMFHLQLVSSNSNPSVNIPLGGPGVQNSVPLVNVYDSEGSLISTGSACLMSPNLLLTNRHVIEGASSITVDFNANPDLSGIEIKSDLLYTPASQDMSMDYAVLRIDTSFIPENVQLTPLKWGNSDLVRNGDLVLAYGYPGLSADGGGVDFSVTSGIVSNRAFSIDTAIIKLNCDIYPGNSGGPSLNETEEVIAINTYVTQGEYLGQALSIKINHILEDPIIQSINWTGIQPLDIEY